MPGKGRDRDVCWKLAHQFGLYQSLFCFVCNTSMCPDKPIHKQDTHQKPHDLINFVSFGFRSGWALGLLKGILVFYVFYV